MDFDKVLVLIEAMNRERVDYTIFGALALAAHGLVRSTEDADFFINPSTENIERLKKALHTVWDDPNIEQIDAAELNGDYPAVSYWPPGEDFGIDFVVRLGEAFSHDGVPHEMSNLDGVPVRVVTARCLYEMKRDTVRHKDRIDAEALRQQFGIKED
jgi:hypothetical protein